MQNCEAKLLVMGDVADIKVLIYSPCPNGTAWMINQTKCTLVVNK